MTCFADIEINGRPRRMIVDGGYLVIKPFDKCAYPIALDRVNSPHKIVVWIRHLSEKTWWTNSMCLEFIAITYSLICRNQFDEDCEMLR